jgi:hypothetical protein
MIHKSWLLVVLGSACAILLTACEAGSGGGGGGDGGSDNANLNDNSGTGGNSNDNSPDTNVNDNMAGGGGDGNDNSANGNDNAVDDNLNANDNTEPPTDGNVNDNTTDNVNANDNTTGGGGGGGGGGATNTITPGSGAAGIVLGQSTLTEVEALLGTPDDTAPGVYTYVSLGIYVWFNDQDVVRKLLLGAPNAARTPGGNGIGSTLAQFRAEFGNDDVPDAQNNFRVWEADGIAARFESTSGLAVGIEILLPV